MPKTSIDYSRGCIYKLVCNDLDITECYVGSTTSFSKRKAKHKSNCNNENDKSHNFYVYQFIRDHGGWDNWSMLEIEKYECKDGRDLETRERYWIEELKAVLNQKVPTRTQVEYRIDNKEKIKEQRKQYYNNTSHIRKEVIRQYKINNKEKLKKTYDCECGGKYVFSGKARHFKTKLHQAFIQTI